ncbi:MAG TPA: transporter substrate-binding domain-containing protein [Thermoplasmata archaeon]|nr:transporter substrate-binding domain-containing protein [Thermoplasmata archaeon]
MAEPAAPPPEAVRSGVSKTMFAVTVVIVGIVALLAGIGLGNVLYGVRPPRTTFIVGTNVPFPPFEDFNTTLGEFVGFDIDISRFIAENLSRTMVVRQFSNFQVLLATVGTGGVDMAASAITSSGDTGQNRSRYMAFSDSYYDANQGVLVQTGSSLTCTSSNCTADNLWNLQVGVQTGTTSEGWLDANKAANTTKVRFQTVDAELAALRQGTIDAVIIDYGPALSFANAPGSGLRVAGQIITNELYSFAVPLGDPDHILPIINSVLRGIKDDGTYDQLIAKWFG